MRNLTFSKLAISLINLFVDTAREFIQRFFKALIAAFKVCSCSRDFGYLIRRQHYTHRRPPRSPVCIQINVNCEYQKPSFVSHRCHAANNLLFQQIGHRQPCAGLIVYRKQRSNALQMQQVRRRRVKFRRNQCLRLSKPLYRCLYDRKDSELPLKDKITISTALVISLPPGAVYRQEGNHPTRYRLSPPGPHVSWETEALPEHQTPVFIHSPSASIAIAWKQHVRNSLATASRGDV